MSKIVNRDADPSGKNGSVDKLLEKPDTVKYMDETIKSWKDKVKSDIKAHLDNKKDTKAWKERLQFLVDSSSYIESFDQKWQEWKSGQENASTESSDKTSDNTGNKENQTTSKTDIKQFTDKVEQYKKDYDEDSYVDAWYEDAYDETQKMYDNEEITMDEMFEMRQKLVKEREKLSSQKQTKSVIGNDYTQLTTEDESGTPEGEAHNTIVGRLKSMGIKHPTKKDIQQAANDLRDRSIKTIISSYNADTISRNLALANAYGSISNASKLTVERVLKDTLERGSGATREQQCDAISKLCGNGSEYEYESFGDNVSVRASDGDGNPIAVTIEPTVKGLFKVEFVYGDGERGKETYDSIDSVKKATESWIKKEEKHTTDAKESEDSYMVENPELSDLEEADPYSEIVGENGVTFVKTKDGWVSPDYNKKLGNQEMLSMMDNIGGYLDTRGKGNPNTKPKSKYDINDPSLTNGL